MIIFRVIPVVLIEHITFSYRFGQWAGQSNCEEQRQPWVHKHKVYFLWNGSKKCNIKALHPCKKGINSGTFCKLFYIALTRKNSVWEQDSIIMNAEPLAHPCYRYRGEISVQKFEEDK